MESILEMLLAGWQAISDYITVHRIIMLTIAFFISGAISQFMSRGAVIKYFGPDANKVFSYLIASVSGVILAVCSCSVLPMFASIRKKGAGIGPAVTFLFSGPAINILAIIFTFNLIGIDIGIVRISGALIISVLIGIAMAAIYGRKEEKDENASAFKLSADKKRKPWQSLIFFATLVAVLFSGVRNPVLTLVFLSFLAVQLILFFTKTEIIQWCRATFELAKKIAPLFILGIFIAGVIETVISPEFIARYVGNNSFAANAFASVFGAFMYFATLTEVPVVNSFIALGMLSGPATALLLAGPSLSLPNMIVISRVMGLKRTLTYIGLVVLFSALAGMVAGMFIF